MPGGVRQGCALGLAMSKWRFANPQGGILPSVKVDAFSKIMRPSLGKLIREVDAMLRPDGVLYVGFQSIATFCS